MRNIYEHKNIKKTSKRLPSHVVKKYELWKDVIFRHGPQKLREFPGFKDEALAGRRTNQRSSRLSMHYRLIYTVEKATFTVYVLEITAHEY